MEKTQSSLESAEDLTRKRVHRRQLRIPTNLILVLSLVMILAGLGLWADVAVQLQTVNDQTQMVLDEKVEELRSYQQELASDGVVGVPEVGGR